MKIINIFFVNKSNKYLQERLIGSKKKTYLYNFYNKNSLSSREINAVTNNKLSVLVNLLPKDVYILIIGNTSTLPQSEIKIHFNKKILGNDILLNIRHYQTDLYGEDYTQDKLCYYDKANQHVSSLKEYFKELNNNYLIFYESDLCGTEKYIDDVTNGINCLHKNVKSYNAFKKEYITNNGITIYDFPASINLATLERQSIIFVNYLPSSLESINCCVSSMVTNREKIKIHKESIQKIFKLREIQIIANLPSQLKNIKIVGETYKSKILKIPKKCCVIINNTYCYKMKQINTFDAVLNLRM